MAGKAERSSLLPCSLLPHGMSTCLLPFDLDLSPLPRSPTTCPPSHCATLALCAAHCPGPPAFPCPARLQAEDAEGETPLGAAAAHGKLRDGLAAIAKGELDPEDLMIA